MIQRRSGPRFTPKTLERVGVAGELLWQKLERHEPTEVEVFGLVHYAHAAGTELFDEAVMGNGVASHDVE